MESQALLISRSCTTGWLDWIHGELWITPRALVRVRLGLWETLGHGAGSTVPDPVRADRNAPQFAPDVVRSQHPTNTYVEFDDMATAALHQGPLSGRLAVTTRTGAKHTWLWLQADPAFEVLRITLPHAIPGRLTLD